MKEIWSDSSLIVEPVEITSHSAWTGLLSQMVPVCFWSDEVFVLNPKVDDIIQSVVFNKLPFPSDCAVKCRSFFNFFFFYEGSVGSTCGKHLREETSESRRLANGGPGWINTFVYQQSECVCVCVYTGVNCVLLYTLLHFLARLSKKLLRCAKKVDSVIVIEGKKNVLSWLCLVFWSSFIHSAIS